MDEKALPSPGEVAENPAAEDANLSQVVSEGKLDYKALDRLFNDELKQAREKSNIFALEVPINSNGLFEWLLPLRLTRLLPPESRFLETYFVLDYLISRIVPETEEEPNAETRTAEPPVTRLRDALGKEVDPVMLERVTRLRNALLHDMIEPVAAAELEPLTDFLHHCIATLRNLHPAECSVQYLFDVNETLGPALHSDDPIYRQIVLFEMRRYRSSYFRDKNFDRPAAVIVLQWLKKARARKNRDANSRRASNIGALVFGLVKSLIKWGLAGTMHLLVILAFLGTVFIPLIITFALAAKTTFSSFEALTTFTGATMVLSGVVVVTSLLLIVRLVEFWRKKPILRETNRITLDDWNIKYNLLLACADLERRLKHIAPPATQRLSLGELVQFFEGEFFHTGSNADTIPDDDDLSDGGVVGAADGIVGMVRIDHLNWALKIRNILVHPRDGMQRCSVGHVRRAAQTVSDAIRSLPSTASG